MSKNYSRLKSVYLPRPAIHKSGLKSLLVNRSSFRKFSSRSISKQTLSNLLYYSSGYVRKTQNRTRTVFHRPYPSAGNKYPLEIYPLIQYGKGLSRGLYYYDPTRHALDVLLCPLKKTDYESLWLNQKYFRKAAVILIITSVYTRTIAKYGRAGLPFPYIEAGHLGQNIYLLCQTENIGCCAIGQLKIKPLIKLLDINPFEEYPVYYIAIGN